MTDPVYRRWSDDSGNSSSSECSIEQPPSINQGIALQSLKTIIEKLDSEFESKCPTLMNHIENLNKITDDFESMHTITTIGSLSGAVVGAAGGITSILGLVLAPFTLGASLAVTGVGVAMAATGGVTGATCNMTNTIKQKRFRETIKNIIDDFQSNVDMMLKYLNAISETVEVIEMMPRMMATDDLAESVDRVGIGAVKAAGCLVADFTWEMGNVAAKAVNTLRVAKAITGVASGLFVILDVVCIVKDSQEIHEINTSADKRNKDDIKSNTLKFIWQMREMSGAFQKTVNEIESTIKTAKSYLQALPVHPMKKFL